MSFDPYSSALPKGDGGKEGLDPKVTSFIQKQVQTVQAFQMLEKVTEVCWDLCDITPKDRLDGRSETCFRNCSARYQDTAQFVMSRLLSRAQQQ